MKWSARALAPRVRDLVYDFARKVYAGFIARQQWAPATRRDESYFLVSEMTKERNKPLARIVRRKVRFLDIDRCGLVGQHKRD